MATSSGLHRNPSPDTPASRAIKRYHSGISGSEASVPGDGGPGRRAQGVDTGTVGARGRGRAGSRLGGRRVAATEGGGRRARANGRPPAPHRRRRPGFHATPPPGLAEGGDERREWGGL